MDEGLDEDDIKTAIPCYKNNNHCCSLIARSQMRFVGILPLLDDCCAARVASAGASTASRRDEHFCATLMQVMAGIFCKAKDEGGKGGAYLLHERQIRFLLHEPQLSRVISLPCRPCTVDVGPQSRHESSGKIASPGDSLRPYAISCVCSSMGTHFRMLYV